MLIQAQIPISWSYLSLCLEYLTCKRQIIADIIIIHFQLIASGVRVQPIMFWQSKSSDIKCFCYWLQLLLTASGVLGEIGVSAQKNVVVAPNFEPGSYLDKLIVEEKIVKDHHWMNRPVTRKLASQKVCSSYIFYISICCLARRSKSTQFSVIHVCVLSILLYIF